MPISVFFLVKNLTAAELNWICHWLQHGKDRTHQFRSSKRRRLRSETVSSPKENLLIRKSFRKISHEVAEEALSS